MQSMFGKVEKDSKVNQMSKGNKFLLWVRFKNGSKNKIGRYPTRRSAKTVESWVVKYLQKTPYFIAYLYDLRTKDRPCICVYHPEYGRMTQQAWENHKNGKVKIKLEVKLMMLLDGMRGVSRKANKLPYPIYLKSKNPDDAFEGLVAISKQVRNHEEFEYFKGGVVYLNGEEVGKMDDKLRFSSIDSKVILDF